MIGISSAPLPRMWRLQAASRSTALGRGSSWNSADRWANISLRPSLATWAHGPGWILQTVLPGPLSCHQAQIVRLSGRHIPPSAGLAAPERRWSPCAYLGRGFLLVIGQAVKRYASFASHDLPLPGAARGQPRRSPTAAADQH